MKYENMNITVDITTKCNLRCKHCRTNSINHELSMDEIDTIIEKCKPFKPRAVFISGGEPLVRKDIVDIVKKFKRLAPITIINTNSLLLTEELLKDLIDGGTNYIQVSLDGVREEHDKVRGVGTYDRVIEKLKLINKYNSKIKLHISSLVSSLNVDQMEEFVHQIIDVNKIEVEILGFKRFIPNNEMAGVCNLGKTGLKKMFENLQELQVKYNDKVQIVADFPLKNVYQKDFVKKIMDKYKLDCAGCSAGVNGICVRNDGTVSPCSLLYISCGNILKQELSEILDSEPIKLLKRRELKGKCGTCKYKMICGGCRAAAYMLSGDYLGEDLECYYVES